MKIYYITINQVFELMIQQIYVLSFLTDKVLKRFDEGLLTGMILIDLQKAFDAIDFVTKTLSDQILRKHYEMV